MYEARQQFADSLPHIMAPRYWKTFHGNQQEDFLCYILWSCSAVWLHQKLRVQITGERPEQVVAWVQHSQWKYFAHAS